MIKLPRSDYVAPPASRAWLAGAAVIVLAFDTVAHYYELKLPFLEGWLARDLLRFLGAMLVIVPLLILRRILPLDVGMTLGRPKVTMVWIAFPAALVVTSVLILSVVIILAIRSTGWKIPIEPSDVSDPSGAWRNFWFGCVMAPVVEEVPYRGLLVAALDRPNRRWIALVGSGVAFALLHFLYGRPLIFVFIEYFPVGIVLAWAFLRARSLLAPIGLHAMGNGMVLGKDLLLYYHRDFFARLLGYP